MPALALVSHGRKVEPGICASDAFAVCLARPQLRSERVGRDTSAGLLREVLLFVDFKSTGRTVCRTSTALQQAFDRHAITTEEEFSTLLSRLHRAASELPVTSAPLMPSAIAEVNVRSVAPPRLAGSRGFGKSGVLWSLFGAPHALQHRSRRRRAADSPALSARDIRSLWSTVAAQFERDERSPRFHARQSSVFAYQLVRADHAGRDRIIDLTDQASGDNPGEWLGLARSPFGDRALCDMRRADTRFDRAVARSAAALLRRLRDRLLAALARRLSAHRPRASGVQHLRRTRDRLLTFDFRTGNPPPRGPLRGSAFGQLRVDQRMTSDGGRYDAVRGCACQECVSDRRGRRGAGAHRAAGALGLAFVAGRSRFAGRRRDRSDRALGQPTGPVWHQHRRKMVCYFRMGSAVRRERRAPRAAVAPRSGRAIELGVAASVDSNVGIVGSPWR